MGAEEDIPMKVEVSIAESFANDLKVLGPTGSKIPRNIQTLGKHCKRNLWPDPKYTTDGIHSFSSLIPSISIQKQEAFTGCPRSVGKPVDVYRPVIVHARKVGTEPFVGVVDWTDIPINLSDPGSGKWWHPFLHWNTDYSFSKGFGILHNVAVVRSFTKQKNINPFKKLLDFYLSFRAITQLSEKNSSISRLLRGLHAMGEHQPLRNGKVVSDLVVKLPQPAEA